MQHSERNHSKTEPMRFIQMWILPARRGLEPSMDQREFSEEHRRGRLAPVLVPADGYGGPDAPTDPAAATVHQDASVYAALLDGGDSVTHRFRDGFGGYAFVVHGSAHVAGKEDGGELDEGGGAKVTGEVELTLRAGSDGAEVLLVETRTAGRTR
jgi:redox-sensitive bicupin YhaK (pirin superfamily)